MFVISRKHFHPVHRYSFLSTVVRNLTPIDLLLLRRKKTDCISYIFGRSDDQEKFLFTNNIDFISVGCGRRISQFLKCVQPNPKGGATRLEIKWKEINHLHQSFFNNNTLQSKTVELEFKKMGKPKLFHLTELFQVSSLNLIEETK